MDLLREVSIDPNVTSIKITIYRADKKPGLLGRKNTNCAK
jgi:polyphosphate kinase